MDMDCGVYAPANDGGLCARVGGGSGGGGGRFSCESEHDLAVMVSDFLEDDSGDTDSRYSSDSDSGFYDLTHLAHNISCCKHSMNRYESDLLSVVNSLVQSINGTDLHFAKSSPCNAGCIRFSLVKLLRLSGYDAAVCTSKWQACSCRKVPGGNHEFIDVVNYKQTGGSERLIIDIDFRSHFEIARAVESYDRILNSLPVVFVGSLTKLKQFLQVMVEATRSSLKQNSMPLPPWRSLAYLQAKWLSPYDRQFSPDKHKSSHASGHMQCIGHLKRLQSLLKSEIEFERLLKPVNTKFERRRHSSIRIL